MLACTHIVYIFNQKLFEVVLAQRQSIAYYYNPNISKSNNAKNTQYECHVNDRQLKILAVITKMSVIMIALGILVTLFFIVEIIWIRSGQTDETLPGMIESVSIRILSACCELCIFLTFGMNRELYTKICKRCDSKLSTYCEHIAIDSIEHNRKKSLKRHIEREIEAHSKGMGMGRNDNNLSVLRMPSTSQTTLTMGKRSRSESTSVSQSKTYQSIATGPDRIQLPQVLSPTPSIRSVMSNEPITPRSSKPMQISVPIARQSSVISSQSTFSIPQELNAMPTLPELQAMHSRSVNATGMPELPDNEPMPRTVTDMSMLSDEEEEEDIDVVSRTGTQSILIVEDGVNTHHIAHGIMHRADIDDKEDREMVENI